MILQTLLSIAMVAVIAGAILTSALANAKVAAHQAATRMATAALARGTDEFVNWAQRYVAKHGAATTWPTTVVVDQPVEICEINQSACRESVTVKYQIFSDTAQGNGGSDPANNLQVGLGEQRISGIVFAEVTNPLGINLASSSSLVTIRLINVAPFAVLSGYRSVDSLFGSQTAFQGDTGGYLQEGGGQARSSPAPTNPSLYKNTVIKETMSCQNSVENSYMATPMLDDSSPGNDSLPWGKVGHSAFETPCTPSYSFSPNPVIPPDAISPQGNVYDIESLRSVNWSLSKNEPAWPR